MTIRLSPLTAAVVNSYEPPRWSEAEEERVRAALAVLPADARDDWQPAPSGLDCSRDDALVFGELQRKELSGSSGCEQGGGTMANEIIDVLLVRA